MRKERLQRLVASLENLSEGQLKLVESAIAIFQFPHDFRQHANTLLTPDAVVTEEVVTPSAAYCVVIPFSVEVERVPFGRHTTTCPLGSVSVFVPSAA